MKTFLKTIAMIAVMSFAFLNPGAHAATLAMVGQQDELVAHGTGLLPSQEAEWVSTVLGRTVNINYVDQSSAGDWHQVIDAVDLWAYELQPGNTPEYYVLKLGVGNSGADNFYLFRNVTEFNWAVISMSEMASVFDDTKNDCPARGNCLTFNVGRISHISSVGSVPLPGTLGLMGLGLAGLGFVRRKQTA